jgi:hypothetical protein
MPIVAGTSSIKLENINDIVINNQLFPNNNNSHSGDNILDGVELKVEKGESIRVASGRDRAVSEKVSLSFEIVEGTEAELAKLLACNNAKCDVEIAKADNTNTVVAGFLSVNRAVGKMISYKCSMEITAEDADTIVGWYV